MSEIRKRKYIYISLYAIVLMYLSIRLSSFFFFFIISQYIEMFNLLTIKIIQVLLINENQNLNARNITDQSNFFSEL